MFRIMRNKNHKSDSPPLGVLALFFVILIFHEAGVEGQDYHFTQYFAAPLLEGDGQARRGEWQNEPELGAPSIK